MTRIIMSCTTVFLIATGLLLLSGVGLQSQKLKTAQVDSIADTTTRRVEVDSVKILKKELDSLNVTINKTVDRINNKLTILVNKPVKYKTSFVAPIRPLIYIPEIKVNIQQRDIDSIPVPVKAKNKFLHFLHRD